MIFVVAAHAKNYVIGCDGRIPWNLPEDRLRFKKLTTGEIVIMGRRTFEEIGCPLPDRHTIVVSSTREFRIEGCQSVTSLAEALSLVGKRDAFVCGGERLYREAIPLADAMFITEIQREFRGDTFFPEFNAAEFTRTVEKSFNGALPFEFVTYKRKI